MPPPMIEDSDEAASIWWDSLDEKARDKWADRVGRTFDVAGKAHPRPERILRRMAFDMMRPDAPHDAPDGAPRNRAMKQ